MKLDNDTILDDELVEKQQPIRLSEIVRLGLLTLAAVAFVFKLQHWPFNNELFLLCFGIAFGYHLGAFYFLTELRDKSKAIAIVLFVGYLTYLWHKSLLTTILPIAIIAVISFIVTFIFYNKKTNNHQPK